MFHSGLSAKCLLPSLPMYGGRWRPLGRRGRPSQILQDVYGKDTIPEECLVGMVAYATIVCHDWSLGNQWLACTYDPDREILEALEIEDLEGINSRGFHGPRELPTTRRKLANSLLDVPEENQLIRLSEEEMASLLETRYREWEPLYLKEFPLLTQQKVEARLCAALQREDIRRRFGAIHSGSESSLLWVRRCAFLWRQWYFYPLQSQE